MAAGMAVTAASIAMLPPGAAPLATKTPAATAMAGAQTTINNRLKAVAATATETAAMTAMTMTMETKAAAVAAAAAAAAEARQQCGGGG